MAGVEQKNGWRKKDTNLDFDVVVGAVAGGGAHGHVGVVDAVEGVGV